MPAAAFLGAASAFGLASLLPLRVPIGKPLLSCNETYLNQTDIRLDGNLYECFNGTILVSCPEQIVNSENKTNAATCTNGKFACNLLENPQTNCSNATLSFQKDIFCNSTYYVNVKNATELHCFFGTLDDSQVVYIPTANPLYFTTTMRPVTTTKKPLIKRMAYVVYSNILWGLGKPELPKQTTTETPISSTENPISSTEKLPEIRNITFPDFNSTSIDENLLDNLSSINAEKRSEAIILNDTVILTEEEKIVETHKIIEQKLSEIQEMEVSVDSGNNDLKKMNKMFQKSD